MEPQAELCFIFFHLQLAHISQPTNIHPDYIADRKRSQTESDLRTHAFFPRSTPHTHTHNTLFNSAELELGGGQTVHSVDIRVVLAMVTYIAEYSVRQHSQWTIAYNRALAWE